MKSQIMDGKITENLGFKSSLWKAKLILPFLFSFSNSSKKICISLFLTIFEYQGWVKILMITLISNKKSLNPNIYFSPHTISDVCSTDWQKKDSAFLSSLAFL